MPAPEALQALVAKKLAARHAHEQYLASVTEYQMYANDLASTVLEERDGDTSQCAWTVDGWCIVLRGGKSATSDEPFMIVEIAEN